MGVFVVGHDQKTGRRCGHGLVLVSGKAHDPAARRVVALAGVLRRFAEFQSLEGASGRRAVIERAKGILMERHAIDEQRAFELLRDRSRHARRKLIDVAHATVELYLLLPGAPSPLRSVGHRE